MQFRYPKKNTLNLAAIAVLFIAAFYSTFLILADRFNAADSYYSHGFLIPFVCGFLIWRKRKALCATPIKPSLMGLPILIVGLILHVVSRLLKINFIDYLSIIVVLEGIILYLWGKQINRQLLFPLLFLIFMLPLPSVVIIGISFKMKIFAASVATNLAHKLGIPAMRGGSTIYLPNGLMEVGDPCSGLRSLISLLALGAIFTQFINGSIWQKVTLFCIAAPVAFVSNMLRILGLVVVYYVYGEKVALGFFHDLSGMLVFVFAFFGLIFATKIIRCRFIYE